MNEENCENVLKVHGTFIVCSYLFGSIKTVRKNVYERRCNGVYLYHYTYNFFHNNRPGKPLPGHSSFFEPFLEGSFFVGMEGDGRTDDPPAGRLHGRAWCGRFAGSY